MLKKIIILLFGFVFLILITAIIIKSTRNDSNEKEVILPNVILKRNKYI